MPREKTDIEKRFDEKRSECLYYMPNVHHGDHGLELVHNCIRGEDGSAKLKHAHLIEGFACADCALFKHKHIQFPLTINEIKLPEIRREDRRCGCPVSIRPVKEDKTYFGIYLGDLPWVPGASFHEKTGELEFTLMTNPAILVPALGRIVYGAESWWQEIESSDDLKEITDDTIGSQWYVQLARQLSEQTEKGGDES